MTSNGQGTANSDVVIDVRGLNKHFGENHAVKDLTLTVRRGEIFGFLGPNGSGKTTSIRMLCGLLTPDSGEGTCLGYDIRQQTREIKRHVGYMTQRFSFWEDLTIRENLRFIARMYGMPDGAAAGRPGARASGPREPRQPAGGVAVRRLEAASRARSVPAARPAAAPARRADRRRRSEGPARFLGGVARARRARHHRAGQHALHGRSRALPQARLHPVRQAVGARDRRRGHRQPIADDLGDHRYRSAGAGRATARSFRQSSRSPHSATRSTSPGRIATRSRRRSPR